MQHFCFCFSEVYEELPGVALWDVTKGRSRCGFGVEFTKHTRGASLDDGARPFRQVYNVPEMDLTQSGERFSLRSRGSGTRKRRDTISCIIIANASLCTALVTPVMTFRFFFSIYRYFLFFLILPFLTHLTGYCYHYEIWK